MVPLIDDMYHKPDDVEIWCEIGGPQVRGELYLTVSKEGPNGCNLQADICKAFSGRA